VNWVTFQAAIVSVSYPCVTDLGLWGRWSENGLSPHREPELSSHTPVSWPHGSQRNFILNFHPETGSPPL